APVNAQSGADVRPDSAIQYGVFADVVFADSSRTGRELQTGEADFYASKRFSDRWSVFGEIFAKHGSDSLGEEATGADLNVERVYVAYDPSDVFRIEAGQIHTGIIQWNEREHRGRFLQTSIDVPTIANREEQGGAWPLHYVGLWAHGRLPGSLGLQYGAGLGETRGSKLGEIQPPTFDDVT